MPKGRHWEKCQKSQKRCNENRCYQSKRYKEIQKQSVAGGSSKKHSFGKSSGLAQLCWHIPKNQEHPPSGTCFSWRTRFLDRLKSKDAQNMKTLGAPPAACLPAGHGTSLRSTGRDQLSPNQTPEIHTWKPALGKQQTRKGKWTLKIWGNGP